MAEILGTNINTAAILVRCNRSSSAFHDAILINPHPYPQYAEYSTQLDLTSFPPLDAEQANRDVQTHVPEQFTTRQA
jgi:hypothetical protein